MDEQQNALRNGVYQANTAKVEVTSSIAQNSDKQNSLNREQPVLDRELAGLADQLNRLQIEEEKLVAQKSRTKPIKLTRHKSSGDLTAAHVAACRRIEGIQRNADQRSASSWGRCRSSSWLAGSRCNARPWPGLNWPSRSSA